jgi:uncharacterized protein YndB with AHSA1/START domain
VVRYRFEDMNGELSGTTRTIDEPGSGPLADAELISLAGEWTLRLTRDLEHSVAAVWSALTEPTALARWAPFTAERDLGAEGDVMLTMLGESPEENQALPSIVTRADPPRMLAFTWGPDVVQWHFEPVGGGTRLTLRHTMSDHQMLSAVTAGWHLCLEAADQLLRGQPVPSVIGPHARDYGWDLLNERYAVVLGVPPSQVW